MNNLVNKDMMKPKYWVVCCKFWSTHSASKCTMDSIVSILWEKKSLLKVCASGQKIEIISKMTKLFFGRFLMILIMNFNMKERIFY